MFGLYVFMGLLFLFIVGVVALWVVCFKAGRRVAQGWAASQEQVEDDESSFTQ